jgi:hypothetical protein
MGGYLTSKGTGRPIIGRNNFEFEFDFAITSRVEVGSNIRIVTLRVVGGDEKGISAWGYNWRTLF